MIYTPKHFSAKELVDPHTYAKYGEAAFMFLRPELLIALDKLREFFGVPVYVNDWDRDGQYHWSGLRTIECTIGATLSAHRLGAGSDLKIKGVDPAVAQKEIIANQLKFPEIRRMEKDTATWSHIDVIEWEGSGILLIANPESTNGSIK